MNEPLASTSPAALAPKPCRRGSQPALEERARIRRWVEFLSDESPVVWQEIQRQFEAAGRRARPALLRAQASADARTRLRARHLLAQLDRKRAWRRLFAYCSQPEIELERGLFLLSAWMDPSFDAQATRRELDRLASRVTTRVAERTDELRRAGSLCDVLGREEGFGGSLGEFDDPDNVLFHRSLLRKGGMPLTLSAIYKFVAKRAGISIWMLPIPGHVLVRVPMPQRTLIADPYDRGRLRSERECRVQLEKAGLKFQASWFQDASDRYMLRRQLMNLAKSLKERSRAADAARARILVNCLENGGQRRAR